MCSRCGSGYCSLKSPVPGAPVWFISVPPTTESIWQEIPNHTVELDPRRKEEGQSWQTDLPAKKKTEGGLQDWNVCSCPHRSYKISSQLLSDEDSKPVQCFSHVVVTEIARFLPLVSAAGLSGNFLPLSFMWQASNPGKGRVRSLCWSNLKNSWFVCHG